MGCMSDTKNCEVCESPIVRTVRIDGRSRSDGQFARRKFCSSACSRRAAAERGMKRHGVTRADWNKGQSDGPAHMLNTCEACGTNDELSAHHCDHNRANNEPSNIQTLCRSCHSAWHHAAVGMGFQVSGRMPICDLELATDAATTFAAFNHSREFASASELMSAALGDWAPTEMSIRGEMARFRIGRGLSSKEASKLVGMPDRQWQAFERNLAEPRITDLRKIADLMGTSVGALAEMGWPE
jgi:hypothetical protein